MIVEKLKKNKLSLIAVIAVVGNPAPAGPRPADRHGTGRRAEPQSAPVPRRRGPAPLAMGLARRELIAVRPARS